jgi:hypothetical protein
MSAAPLRVLWGLLFRKPRLLGLSWTCPFDPGLEHEAAKKSGVETAGAVPWAESVAPAGVGLDGRVGSRNNAGVVGRSSSWGERNW